MTDKQEKAIKNLKKAVKRFEKAGCSCFCTGSLFFFDIPHLPHTEGGGVDPDKVVDSMLVHGWDGGDF